MTPVLTEIGLTALQESPTQELAEHGFPPGPEPVGQGPEGPEGREPCPPERPNTSDDSSDGNISEESKSVVGVEREAFVKCA